MAKTRPTHTTECLKVEFTHEQLLTFGRELGEAHNKLADIEDQEKAAKAQFRERSSRVEADISSLSRKLTIGYEMVDVRCRFDYDKPNINEVTLIREDTGAVVRVRALTAEERQTELPFEPVTEQAAATSLEQSQAAVNEFFGPGRPTEQPTAETAAPIVIEDSGIGGVAEELTPQQAEKEFAAMVGAPVPIIDESFECPDCHQAFPTIDGIKGHACGKNLPSAADLDAVAGEQQAAESTASATPEPEPASRKKSGPKDSAKFHEEQVAKDAKTARRPDGFDKFSTTDNW